MAVTATQRALPRAPRLKLAARRAIWFYVFILPWILGFVIFTAGPIVASAYLSLTINDPVNWPPKWVGTANYQMMFSDPLFWQSLKVTSYFTVVFVPLSVAAAVFVALLLNERLPGLSIWRTVYYLPAVLQGVGIALMWAWVFQPTFGLLNGTLYSLFGIEGPRWLINDEWVIPTFVLMSLWQFGGPMLIYLASIQGVPSHLYEAAEIDGAGKFQQIWHITIPSITPVIFFNGIMSIIGSFQTFTNAYVITQGGPNYASYFYVLHIYNNAFKYISNMGYADALSWVLFVIMLGFTGLAFKSAQYWVYYETDLRGGGR